MPANFLNNIKRDNLGKSIDLLLEDAQLQEILTGLSISQHLTLIAGVKTFYITFTLMQKTKS